MREDFVVKYLWGAAGYLLCSAPVFLHLDSSNPKDIGGRTQEFVTNRRLLVSAAEAFGRIMLSYRDISELAGYTQRVDELITVFDDILLNKFDKKLSPGANEDILKNRGEMKNADIIEFDHVPVVAPNGDLLVRDLCFNVRYSSYNLGLACTC